MYVCHTAALQPLLLGMEITPLPQPSSAHSNITSCLIIPAVIASLIVITSLQTTYIPHAIEC